MTFVPPGLPLRPHLLQRSCASPWRLFFLAFLADVSCGAWVRAALERVAFAQRLFPSPQFDFAHADPDSQRGAFELVAAALNGEAPLPRQTGTAARPAHGGDGTIVRIDVALICCAGRVGTGVTLGSAQTCLRDSVP